VVNDCTGPDTGVVLPNYGTDTVTLLLGQGNATFKERQGFATAPGPTAVIAGDFNGDMLPDLAAVDATANHERPHRQLEPDVSRARIDDLAAVFRVRCTP